MKGSVVAIDIKDFAKLSKDMTSKEISDFLIAFYDNVFEEIKKDKWDIVKIMADCVVIAKSTSVQESEITELYKDLSKSYSITVTHRVCEYEVKNISYGTFQCRDIFGNEINNLFLKDIKTQVQRIR